VRGCIRPTISVLFHYPLNPYCLSLSVVQYSVTVCSVCLHAGAHIILGRRQCSNALCRYCAHRNVHLQIIRIKHRMHVRTDHAQICFAHGCYAHASCTHACSPFADTHKCAATEDALTKRRGTSAAAHVSSVRLSTARQRDLQLHGFPCAENCVPACRCGRHRDAEMCSCTFSYCTSIC
jgi:hypothetical protein